MKLRPVSEWLGPAVLAAATGGLLAGTFRAYQDPAHIAQWLAMLQLCR